ncbi:MAG: sensor histidine kinase [Hyphomicrobium sp.]|nr:sensor histidine kinase [Hyphomicrobium sp.]
MPPAYSFALLSATDAINLILYLVAGAAIIWVAHIYRAALQELQEQKSHNELLTRELNHRSKNSLAVISSIVNQSLKHDTESSQKIIGRLAAMRHGDELIQSGNQPAAPLEAVIRRELEFYDHSRLKMAGAEVQVSGAIARSVCMVIHELATNAVKYGAWSNTTGIVTIIWQTNGSTASIDWKETGGPPPAAKNRAGFGTFLIERLLSQYGGDVQLTWPLSGLVCTLTVPVRVQENEVRT